MTRLYRKAARTPDARKYTKTVDNDRNPIPFKKWLELNRDTIKDRTKTFMLKTYIINSQFIKLGYENIVIRGKKKKEFYEKYMIPVVLQDSRLLLRRALSNTEKGSPHALNLPKDYTQDPNFDKAYLMSFLETILKELYNDLANSEQWKAIDDSFKLQKDSSNFAHIKDDPAYLEKLKQQIEKDILTKLNNNAFKKRLNKDIKTVKQLLDVAVTEILAREPRIQSLKYNTGTDLQISHMAWRDERYMKEFKKAMNDVLATSSTIKEKAIMTLNELSKANTTANFKSRLKYKYAI